MSRLLAWIDEYVEHCGMECLLWPFGKTSRGAAAVSIGGRQFVVARIMCERRHGPAPSPRHQAAHNCGMGHLGCVNPEHLRWATPAENQQDRVRHGTHGRGERGGLALLTEPEVRAIRASREKGTRLAAQHGVSPSTIWAIRHRRIWAWMD